MHPLSYCCIHDKEEPADDNTYRVCFECGHVFQTEDEVINLDVETRTGFANMAKSDTWFDLTGAPNIEIDTDPVPADQIYDCPLCSHSW